MLDTYKHGSVDDDDNINVDLEDNNDDDSANGDKKHDDDDDDDDDDEDNESDLTADGISFGGWVLARAAAARNSFLFVLAAVSIASV